MSYDEHLISMAGGDGETVQERVAKALAEHRVLWMAEEGYADTNVEVIQCSCGQKMWSADYLPHQVASLLPLVAEAQAEAWEEGKESFATALLRPLGRNGMRDGVSNPYRITP